jgi:signal recognition particle receptor subunit beta
MNTDTIKASKMEFHNMLLNPDLANSGILVFANKSDLPSARDAGDLIETYGLEDVRSHEIRV